MKRSSCNSPTRSTAALVAAAVLLTIVQSAAALEIAGCVSPKSKLLPNGNLQLRFIAVYAKPGGNPIYLKISAPLSLYVLEEQGAWLKLAGSPSSPFKEGEEIGWVKRSEVKYYPLRNCNL